MEFSVGIDVGAYTHHVAIVDPDGRLNEAFEIPHQQTGFDHLFSRLDFYQKRLGATAVIGMEGLGGYARPLDRQIQKAGFSLLNLNNLKVNRFRQLFGVDAKSDQRDALMIAQMVRLRTSLGGNGERVLHAAPPVDPLHQRIKRLARRQQRLIEEKVRLLMRMKADLLAVCPSLLNLTRKIDTLWFLRLLVAYPDLIRLKRAQAQALLKIPGLGKSFLCRVQAWQTDAVLSDEADIVGPMRASDAGRNSLNRSRPMEANSTHHARKAPWLSDSEASPVSVPNVRPDWWARSGRSVVSIRNPHWPSIWVWPAWIISQEPP